MTNLMKAEIFKLQRNKTFWVLLLIVTGLSALLHYLVAIDWWQMYNTPFESAGLSELNALSVFTVLLYFNLLVSTLAGFFIAIEFAHSGVIKNQVMSGHKRSRIFIAKYLVFSLGSIIVTVLTPLMTAIIMILLLGYGDILNLSNMMYLGRAYGLFTLQFLGYTALIMLLAIITEDAGKTMIMSIVFTLVMDVIRILSKPPIIEMLYEHSIFHQFSEVFHVTMTNGDMVRSIIIGIITLMVMMLCGLFMFNRKEIK